MPTLFRRWFGGPQTPEGPWPEVRDWAAGAGHRFAVGRGGAGFVVDTAQGGAACRIEWGPPQRNYIGASELRIRADVGPAADLQMLVATRALIDRLEHDVFEQFTEGTQTRIDDQTPEEMRWLVLYPQVPGNVLGALKARFGLLANRPRASTLWLENGLAAPLVASAAWHEAASPMVLVVQRGRFVLRLASAEPCVALVEGALALAAAAAAAARRVSTDVARGSVSSQRPSTWGAPSAMPQEEDVPG